MIAANGVTARYLLEKKFPSLRRVVRTPKRWERIVEIAQEHGFSLPEQPDSKALEEFLIKAKAADPLVSPISRSRLSNSWDRANTWPSFRGRPPPGHFGLAVRDYTHSTAPNRRYPDLITQRLLKAAMAGDPGLIALTSWRNWPNTAPRKRMPPEKWSDRSGNRPPPCSWNRESGNSLMPSSPARPPKVPGSASSSRPLRENWSRDSKAWMSATGFASS